MKTSLIILFVVAFSFGTIKSLIIPGFFPMHDDTQVARVFEMAKSLKDGLFPVRWVSDLGYGYGYPIFNFYAPLPYYVGGFLTLFGFDVLFSTKIMMVIGVVLAGVFMYLLSREFWGRIGGLVSSLFYLYAPYHAVQIFVRGSVGEFWAYAFIPAVFLSFYKIFRQRSWRWIIFGSLSIAAIILSHNLTAMMVVPFLLIFALLCFFFAFKDKKLSVIYNLLFTILLGLLLSAFYWLPAISELKYTNVFSQVGGGANFRDHFVCINQLWESNWGFGGSAPGCTDGLSFRIGKGHILLAVFSFILLPFIFKKDKKIFFVTILFQLLLFVSIFMTLDISKPVWEASPLMTFFQFPWRFLVLISFAASFLSGLTVRYFKNFKNYVAAFAILILFYTTFNLFQPQTILSKKSSDYTSDFSLKWITSKVSDEYMPKEFDKPQNFKDLPKDILIVKKGDAEIEKVEKSTIRINAKINSSSDSIIHVNIAYFPAWKVLINGENSKITPTRDGLDFSIPKGKSSIEVIFDQTSIEKVSNLLSLAGLIVLFAGILGKKKASNA